MKKSFYVFALVAMVFTSCVNEPVGPKKDVNYLRFAHELIGNEEAEAKQKLEDAKFVYDESDKAYTLINNDSSMICGIMLDIDHSKVEYFDVIFAVKKQYEDDINRIHREWSDYAYNVMCNPIGLWFGEIDEFEKKFMDGPELEEWKKKIEAMHQMGLIEKDEYDYYMMMVNGGTRQDFLDACEVSISWEFDEEFTGENEKAGSILGFTESFPEPFYGKYHILVASYPETMDNYYAPKRAAKHTSKLPILH